MAKHLVAFYENLASATLNGLDVVVDDVVNIPQADRFQVPPEYNAVEWIAALGATLARAQLVAPSLEVKRATCEVIPHERGTIAFNIEGPRLAVFPREVVLDVGENVQLQANNTAAGADPVYGLVSLKKPGALPVAPDGPIIMCRATNAVALVANVWNTRTFTLEKELEKGDYALVGFHAWSATGIAARVIIPGLSYRPGVAMIAGATESVCRDFDPQYLKDSLYEMGRFPSTSFPQFQLLASAADAASQIVALLVKVA
jgi:hypothetical protein